jgi:prolyl-tRNA synthetase
MGCYGIGVSRTVQASIEQSHDKDGIIWAKALAPFAVHICSLDPKEPQIIELVKDLSAALEEHKLEVFVDDRDERPGVKFKDADLLGFPLRINIGKKGLEKGELEVVVRRTKQIIKVSADHAFKEILQQWEQLKN